MRIQHNILSMNAYRNYTNNTSALGKNLEKLSSGYKINRAGDDAAGLAISEKMRAQIKGLDAAQKNVKDSISFVKTAEGAMQEIQDMLSRMKYLATQSANGTYQDDVDREALQDEVDSLLDEIDRIAQSANFNDVHMLNGPADGAGGSGLTAADITKPTATGASFADGDAGTNKTATTSFDFAGVAFKADGNVKVSFGGKDYTVAVTKDMTADKFAEAFVTAYNKDQIDDVGGAGKFVAAQDTGTKSKVVFTAQTANTAVTSGDIKTALAKAPTIAPADDTAATGKAKAADAAAAAGADAAKGPTFTENTTGSKLADFELKALDLSNVKGAKDGKVNIEYKADKTLTIKVGDKTYVSAAMNTAPTAGAKVKLYTAGDADGTGDDGYVEVTVGDTVNKLGNTNPITAADVGTVKAAEEGGNNGGGKTGDFTIKFQIGDTSDDFNQLNINIKSMSTASIKVASLKGTGIATDTAASKAIQTIKDAINDVSSVRGQLGAWQNRLEHTANNLSVMHENIQDAESTIRDTDVADEMMAYTKNNILIQSAQAMLAQANAVPQGVLQLLQ